MRRIQYWGGGRAENENRDRYSLPPFGFAPTAFGRVLLLYARTNLGPSYPRDQGTKIGDIGFHRGLRNTARGATIDNCTTWGFPSKLP